MAAAACSEQKLYRQGGWLWAVEPWCSLSLRWEAWLQVVAAAAAASASGWPPMDTQADRLDSLMEQMLAHLQWRCAQGQLGEAWASMLGSFERALLHAHRSKFTQFLLFYLAKQVRRSVQLSSSCPSVYNACCCGRDLMLAAHLSCWGEQSASLGVAHSCGADQGTSEQGLPPGSVSSWLLVAWPHAMLASCIIIVQPLR